MNEYAAWIGYAVMAVSSIFSVAWLLVMAASAANYAVRKLLDAYGGWTVFLEYREWYRSRLHGDKS